MADNIVYINYFGGIDPIRVNKFIVFTNDVITTHSPSEICFFIASAGGDVDSGFYLYNYLISLKPKLKITMHNVGTIDSMANVVFLAGENRYAAPNAAFLFHGIAMNFNQASYGKAAIKENISRLDVMETRMSDTISKRCELSIPEILNLFQQGESKDVNFALEKKIISDIKEPSIPPGSIHLVMNFG